MQSRPHKFSLEMCDAKKMIAWCMSSTEKEKFLQWRDKGVYKQSYDKRRSMSDICKVMRPVTQ